MSNTHILVAEDDANIRNGLVDALESEGYRVTAAANGKEAMDRFAKRRFDLLLLDIMMPEKSGYDVCREVREKDKTVPVIMLSAKSEEIDKVVGLKLGADDYVTKPFGVHELLARISAVLRRARQVSAGDGSGAPDTFKIGKAEVDAKKYRATIGKRTVELSDREVKLLQCFHEHPDEVLSRDQLLNAVWGIDYYGTTRTLDQHIAQLRKKIENRPDKPCVITTVHGVGYRYQATGQ
jgi:DNA-binding response OmpR family regulator